MTKLLLVFMMICFSGLVSAQMDSIQNEIIVSSNSKSMLISKGRTLLLDKFLSKDLAKVAEIENYLATKLSNDDYFALYPSEQWFIKFWTKDYERLISEIRQYDSIYPKLQKKVQPPEDNLYMMLREKTYNQRKLMIKNIEESSLPEQDKDFLILHLNACLMNKDTNDLTQYTLNSEADNFILKYPESKMIDFTRKYIRYKLVPSKWGFTFEFFSGYGIFSGSLKNHYINNIPMGVAFDVYYKNLVLYLRDYIGFSKTRHDFTNGNVVWEKKSQVRVFLPEASLGYVINDGKRFKLAPFVGISSTDISPTDVDSEEKPDLKDYELTFTTTYTVGFNVDIKLNKPKIAIVSTGQEQSYWFLRIRYGYNFPQFSKSYSGFDGNMQYITIGFGGFGRKLKRDY